MLSRLDQQPRRGPWTAKEQAAIDRAIAEGRLQRVKNGDWPDLQPPLSWVAIERAWFAARREISGRR
jgi:hypothetical protein